jgi:hypothetical protein
MNIDIEDYDITTCPNSSFNIFVGKRRSGKSILCEYMIKELYENKMNNCAFLFSKTNAGFDFIKDEDCRFNDIHKLNDIVNNYKRMNEYNKKTKNKKDKFKIKTVCIIDDMALDLKTKDFNILNELAVNGRHCSYPPLSLHIMVLSQSLTKIERVVRLNCDNIIFNCISSSKELELIMDECFYILDNSREGKRCGKDLYKQLITEQDFQFIVVENYKQNCKCYPDYIKKYRAVLF